MNIIESVQKNKLVKELSNGLKEIKILDKTNNILLTHYFEDKNDNYTKFFKQYNFIGEPISKVEYEKLNDYQLKTIHTHYYSFNGKIARKYEKINNLLHGKYETFLSNGVLEKVLHYVRDKKYGPFIIREYRHNNEYEFTMIGTYKNNRYDGEYKEIVNNTIFTHQIYNYGRLVKTIIRMGEKI